MKNLFLISILFLIFFGIGFAGCKNSTRKNQEQTTVTPAQPTAEDLVKKGEYLVNLGGCYDCHAPKEMGPQGPQPIKALWMSGYPSERPIMQGDPKVLKQGWVLFVPDLTSASGPWGVSFSANLTPDQTGIGNWAEENFIRALKEGKFKGIANSRTLLPPMPWQNFATIKEDDLKAIFAYLKSIPPVNNIVPAAIIAEQPPQANQATKK